MKPEGSLSIVPNLSQMNPTYFSNIRFNIILPYSPTPLRSKYSPKHP